MAPWHYIYFPYIDGTTPCEKYRRLFHIPLRTLLVLGGQDRCFKLIVIRLCYYVSSLANLFYLIDEYGFLTSEGTFAREDLAARGGREQDVGVMNAPVTSRLDGHDFASSLYSLYLA